EGVWQALGRPELAARGLSQRAEDQQAVRREFAMEIERRSLAECRALFAELDVCVEPVLSFGEALQPPQIAARGLVTEVPGPQGPRRELGYGEERIRALRESGVLGGA